MSAVSQQYVNTSDCRLIWEKIHLLSRTWCDRKG